ncbi:hypothetical protein KAR91_21565 [Candidatus Pacearchaeota archaeon]|nr:hypothetical protein [Candidatus Pacearchaeota archaeon]
MKEVCDNCLDNIAECECEETQGYSTEGAVCPYCGYTDLASDSEGYIFDESNDTNNCHACGKEYKMELYVSHLWTTNKKDD